MDSRLALIGNIRKPFTRANGFYQGNFLLHQFHHAHAAVGLAGGVKWPLRGGKKFSRNRCARVCRQPIS